MTTTIEEMPLQTAMTTPASISTPTTPQGPATVRILRSQADLDSIYDAWSALSEHPHAHPDFYRAVVATSPNIRHPFVVLIERGGAITSMLIGRLEDFQLDVRIGYVKLPRPKVRSLVFIYGGVLGNPSSEDCALMVDAVNKALAKGEASMAMFNHLRTDSPLYPLLSTRPSSLVRDYSPSLATHRRVTTCEGTEAFWKRLPYKSRGNLRWNMKSFLKPFDGKFTIECFTELSQVDEMVAKTEVIAAKTYQRSFGVGFSSSDAEVARMRLKAEKGWLRNYVLSVEGMPVAFLCGTPFNGTYHADHMGFDPEYRRYSAGIFLTIRVIEELCESTEPNRICAVDFGLGDARYKAEICNESWEDACVYLFAPTFSGVMLNAYRTPALVLDQTARKMLGSQQQEKIKRFWRKLSLKKNQDAATPAKKSAEPGE
jgi:hypothetical protein